MLQLTGKIALVTGGSRAVSRAIALRLAEAGADVILNFMESRAAVDAAAETIAERGRRVAEVLGDVSEPDDVQSMLEWIGETFQRLDILVSVAETEPQLELLGIPLEQLNGLAHSARSLVLLMQAALPLFTAGGKVIAVSEGGQAAGNALEGTVRQLADELSAYNIQINAVRGLITETESPRMSNLSSHNAGAVRLESAADVVLFLSSNLSDAVCGQTLQLGHSSRVPHHVCQPV